MNTNDADAVDALEAAAKALEKSTLPETPKTKAAPTKYEAYDHEGNTVQLDDKPHRQR